MTITQSKTTTATVASRTLANGLVARTRELTSRLREHRAEAEAACRMAPAVHEALARIGLYRATAPPAP